MTYPTIHISYAPGQGEIVAALVGQYPIAGCREMKDRLIVYLEADTSAQPLLDHLAPWIKRLGLQIRVDDTPYENWNARWEANFQPIRVDDFVGIRAEFHTPMAGVMHDVVIQPKMAFGTGHHATTWMMVRQLRDRPLSGKQVLDYGSGTGILAIVAALQGAQRINAVDIEIESYENTLENAAVNGVADRVFAYHGQLADVPADPYEVILANINRNVILASLPALYQRLRPGGDLLLSGLLVADEEIVHEKANESGFVRLDRMEREGWICLVYGR